MRIVMMGTPEFAVPVLDALIRGGEEIVGVFTQPDRPSGRGNRLTPPPVKVAAENAGIPVFQPERISRTGVEALSGLKPDLCVTAAFGQILSQKVLDIPRLGTVNVHASLLPKHRGSSPVAHAILCGDRVTGVTTMMTDAGIDTGDMLLREETGIGESETCAELTERLSVIGARLLMETLSRLKAGTLERTPQAEAEMSYDPMLTKEMGTPGWTGASDEVRGRINGLDPWPCVRVPTDAGMLKLLRAVTADGGGRPGEILTADTKQGLIVACGKGAVRILELQAPGGKRMDARDYLRGHVMTTGTVLGEAYDG